MFNGGTQYVIAFESFIPNEHGAVSLKSIQFYNLETWSKSVEKSPQCSAESEAFQICEM